MKNFRRAIRLALNYRLTIVATVGCSVMIAVLWGGNIAAIYPILEVSFSGKSIPEWSDDQIASAESKAAEFGRQIAEFDARLQDADNAGRSELQAQRRAAETRRDAELQAAQRIRWLRPYLGFLPGDPFQMVMLMIALVMLSTLLKSACVVAHQLLLARLVGLVSVDLQRKFFAHTMAMDPVTFGEKGTSGLMSHMGADIGNVGIGLNSLFGSSLREPLKMLVCFGVAAFVSWRMLLMSLVIAPVAVLLVHSLARSIRRAVQRALDTGVEMNRITYEAFNGLPMVQAYTMEQHERRRFHDITTQSFAKSMKISFYSALSKPLTEVMGVAFLCVSLVGGAYLVLNQQTDILGVPMTDRPLNWPSLFVFYSALAGISDPARKLSDIYALFQRGIAGADRLYEILDQPSRIQDPASPKPLPEKVSRIDLRGVNFHYQPDQPVLKDINLQIKHDEAIAVVGANGCGKSTLANLLPRFYDPIDGAVSIDGFDLRESGLEDLRRRVAVVSQFTMLFDNTVMANIRYGSLDATDEQVRAAARRAHADAFIEKLDEGYETRVGQAGSRLSGGQRQRIILARAILRDPQILILDEATSQIDPESEFLIHKSLKEFIRGRLTVMITHRLSTLDLADRIVVMAEGRIEDVGTHEELLARCNLFRRLCQSDFSASA